MDKYDLLRHSAAFTALHRDAETGRVAHAYLLVSPDEMLSETMSALFLADLIYGSTSAEAAARAETTGADVIRLPHGDRVQVADVQELTDTVYFTPTELSRKYYVIARAETMTEPAQNKLLKVLEEPPSSVVILLLCTRAAMLLPTVLSRSRLVEIGTVNPADLTEYLTRTYGRGERTELAAALSGGYLSRAEAIIKSEESVRTYEFALDVLKNMKNSRNVLSFSARFPQKKETLSELVDDLELLLGDCLLISSGAAEGVRFGSIRGSLEQVAAQYNAEVVMRLRPTLLRARRRIAGNGGLQSILDELLFSLLEVKAKCRK